MNDESRLDEQIYRLTFGSAIVLIASMLVSFALPLDAPGGYDATQGERLTWLLDNRAAFIAGWLNQIVAMVSLTTSLAGFAWLVRTSSPLAALLAALMLLSSFIVFIIPKFIAVWTIPLLAEEAAGGTHLSEMANTLLPLLNTSAPFSLFTAFDYLGFWLYAIFGLIVAPCLFARGSLGKINALCFGLYGLAYHGVAAAILLGKVPPQAVEGYALSSTLLLVIPMFLALGMFRSPGRPA